jgi:hypothetical protein
VDQLEPVLGPPNERTGHPRARASTSPFEHTATVSTPKRLRVRITPEPLIRALASAARPADELLLRRQPRPSKGTMVDLTVRIAMAAAIASATPDSLNGNRVCISYQG